MLDIVGVGESDVDLYLRVNNPPKRGEKVRAEEIGKMPGGMIGNFCSAVAQYGLNCGIVTVVGDDENGEVVLTDYRKRGIDTEGLQIIAGGKTFYCIVHIDETGEKCLTAVVSQLASPKPEQVPVDYIRQAKYVHINSMDYTLAEFVVESLKETKTKVSIDYESHAEKPGFDSWKPILSSTAILFVNEDGLHNLLPNHTMKQAAQQILSIGVERVVVTCAEKGGAIFSAQCDVNYRAFCASSIVDTTGAGDCFNATFLSAIVSGENDTNAARHAAAAAALSLGKIGARTGIPSKAEVLEFLATNPKEIIL